MTISMSILLLTNNITYKKLPNIEPIQLLIFGRLNDFQHFKNAVIKMFNCTCTSLCGWPYNCQMVLLFKNHLYSSVCYRKCYKLRKSVACGVLQCTAPSSSRGINLSLGHRLLDRLLFLAGWGSFLELEQLNLHHNGAIDVQLGVTTVWGGLASSHPHRSTRYDSLALLLGILLLIMVVIFLLFLCFAWHHGSLYWGRSVSDSYI